MYGHSKYIAPNEKETKMVKVFKQQLNLFKSTPTKLTHGGILNQGKRKTARPLIPGKWHHLVMRATKAKGDLSFLRSNNRSKVNSIVKKQSAKFGIAIHSIANVGNHLHLCLKFRTRTAWRKFLVSITALIARAITGARRGHAFGSFWDALSFSRVVMVRRDFESLCDYIAGNIIEAESGRMARESFLTEKRRERAKWRSKKATG
jgi:REP element-mobilizing transposase RayT